MNKTGVVELFANIKKTLISFISITMFVFLGIGVYLGFQWSGMAIKESLEKAYQEGQANDIQVSYIYGVNKEQANALLENENVDQVDLQFKVYDSFNYDGILYQAAIVSNTNEVDTSIILEGNMPTSDDEILVESGTSKTLGIKVGDVITFNNDNGNSNALLNIIKNYDSSKFDETAANLKQEYTNLKHDQFKVVGIVRHPGYLSGSQAAFGVNNDGLQINAVFICNYSAFNETVTGNSYTTLLIKNDDLSSIKSYSNKYEKKSSAVKDLLADQLSQINLDGYNLVKTNLYKFTTDSMKKIGDGEKQIRDGEKKLVAAEKEIAKNEALLIDGKEQLDEGKELLDEAYATIVYGESQINANEAKLNDAEAKLNKAKQVLAALNGDYKTFKTNLPTNLETIKNCLLHPTKDNALAVFDILEQFEGGYSVEEIQELINETDIEAPSDLQDKINTFNDDLYRIEYTFMVDVLDEYLTSASENEAIIEVNKIINKVGSADPNEKLTYKQAVALLKANYKDTGTSLFKYAVGQVWTTASEATISVTITDITKLCNDAISIVDQAKTLADEYISDAEIQIASGKVQLADAKTKLAAGKKEYAEKYELYEESLAKYNEGKKQLDAAKVQVSNGKKQLEQAKLDLADAKKAYDELVEKSEIIKDYGTSIVSKNESIVAIYTNMVSDVIIKLKYSLGGLFLIISIMVCYSVVTRNVNNQITELGTKKAVGFYDKEITIGCLAYSLISVVIGTILGFLLALVGIEQIVVPSIKNVYNYILYPNYFSIIDFIAIFVLELVLMVGVTYFGCRKILKLDAVKLLQGKQPAEAKNRFFDNFIIWKKLSLLSKTIINNCLTDPMRVIATIVGVAGCTSLVVSSITLKDNISKSFARQYDEYYKFDSFVYFDASNETANNDLEAYFEDHNIYYAKVYRTLTYLEYANQPKTFGYEMVFEDNKMFDNLVSFDATQGEFTHRGIWLPESFEKSAGLSIGEPIILSSPSGESYDGTVEGYYKYYSYMLNVFMDSETYCEITGSEFTPNIYIINLNGNDYNAVYEELKDVSGFTSMMNYYQYCKQDIDVFTNLSSIMVGVYLVISVLMSVFVLLNLFSTFIDEKKRELIVLRINGYTIKQANKYIYSDTIFLTFIGIVIGVIVGNIIGDLSVASFESNSLYLLHEINAFACIAGILFTIVLSFIMCRIALRKIKNFNLTDINKV